MKKNPLVFSVISLVLISVLAIHASNTGERNIPFLPIDVNNVNYIGMYGREHRNATEEEKLQIVNWLNSIKEYDKKYPFVIGNGKPNTDNIQVFLKDKSIGFSVNKNGISIGSSVSRTVYVVRQPELSSLLEQIR